MKIKLFLLVQILFTFYTSAQFGVEKDITHSTLGISSVVSVDLDNDGDVDIASASFISDEIVLFENFGNSTFLPSGRHLITAGVDGPVSLKYDDLDNDGDMDLVSASSNDNKIAYYENLGSCDFGPQQIINTGISNLNEIYLTDLDNNGFSDIVISSVGLVKVILNQGSLVFDSPTNLFTTSSSLAAKLHIVDIDGDLDLDIIYGFGNNTNLTKVVNQGGITFSTPQLISNQAYATRYINSFDIDSDSDPDLLIACGDGIKQFINTGSGTFSAPTIIENSFTGCVYVAFRDMDSDGDQDLIWSQAINTFGATGYVGSYWTRKDSLGNFTDIFTITTSTQGNLSLNFADLDNDGDTDFVSGSSLDHKLAYYKNIADTTFEPQKLISGSLASVGGLCEVDVNNDGLPDLISGSSDGRISYFKNTGDRTFDFQKILYSQFAYSNEGGTPIVRAGDIDNDGDTDILAYSTYHSYTNGNNLVVIYWLENNGNETFTVHGLSQPTSASLIDNQLFDAELVDSDNDGDLDIITSHEHEGWIRKFVNQGGGVFGSSQLVNYVTNVKTIAISDMDNDGLKDIVVGSNQISWLRNLGSNQFAQSVDLVTLNGQIPCMEVADLDGDADLDILIGNSFTSQINWLENLGNLTFSSPHVISLQPTSIIRSITPVDLDLDGDLDILYSAYNGSTLTVWSENTGSGNFGPLQAIGGNHLQSITYPMDIDNDGDKDVFVVVNDLGSKIIFYENNFINQSNSSGRIFADLNQNGLFDSTDVGINDVFVFSNPQSDFTFSYANGNYILHLTDSAGIYLIQPNTIPHWSLSTDSAQYHLYLDSLNLNYSNLDFGFSQNDTVHEISASLNGGLAECNTVSNYWIKVKNVGTTVPSGIIELELPTPVNYMASNVIPDSIIGQHLYWHYDSLLYFNSHVIHVQALMPDYSFQGDTMTSRLTVSIIDPIAGIELLTTRDSVQPIHTCAFDPNIKTVTPTGIESPGYIPLDSDWMEYTIYFQNTGTDTASKIEIIDQLDQHLDWSTLTPLSNSHPVVINGNQNGRISFLFDNIHLPDSTTDEPGSHGFINYRIKLNEGLPYGTQILNKADIFFDFNPEITTNQTINTLFECPTEIEYTLSPNPSCVGSVIVGSVNNELFSTNHYWNLSNFETQDSSNFNWISDTTGSFLLTLVVNNPICAQLDTIITINIEECLGLDEFQELVQLDIYPNPANDFTRVHLFSKEKQYYKITLVQLNGQIIQTMEINENETYEMDLSLIESGYYFINLLDHSNQLILTKTIVKY
ncbi:FG-GAP-like repeat-containing protein [uncultured Fluviicola sp.]|uniref:FG-GAP-like repeat-containing protein n=1 Tax=uncultured Fluviicola sp. TaxID=463303 RepID=UPI0025E3D7A1|nr:FG-GAP-like repeat-containing protein [uncultured Fluviicola sp.]